MKTSYFRELKGKTFIFFLVFACLINQKVFSTPTIEEIQNFTMKDLKTVLNWMRDKTTTPRFKVLILERLNILVLENINQINSYQEELKLFFDELSKDASNHTSSYGLIIRKKTCLMLSYFSNTSVENEMYEILKAHIQNDSDNESVASCVRSFGMYTSKKEQSIKFVTKLLENTLKKKKVSDEDIEMATASIELMATFKLKQSVLILMKILDSKYPTEVKNLAKKTLESIPQ